MPVFKDHPKKSRSYDVDNAEALIRQTVERKRCLYANVEPADFKKRQCQRLGEL